MSETVAEIYTDGSCNTQNRIGAWVAIIFTAIGKKVLAETVTNTTHNRMELSAVIKGMEYIKNNYPGITSIKLFSDSQYVVGLPGRKEKLSAAGFSTKIGNDIQNADLVKELFEHLSTLSVEFIKVKAHQKQSEIFNCNIEADKLSRKMMREADDKIK
jgi:ribonuclease HI